jgi:hypothetical protein
MLIMGKRWTNKNSKKKFKLWTIKFRFEKKSKLGHERQNKKKGHRTRLKTGS